MSSPIAYPTLARELDASELERLILLVAPCRSGTTSFVRLFGALGIPAWYQPLKTLLRCHQIGRVARLALRGTSFVKETIGPYSQLESVFDPTELLACAGVPAERVHVIVMMRDPFATAASWIDNLSAIAEPDALVRNLVTAYGTCARISERLRRTGVATTALVYEVFRDHPPGQVLSRLYARLGIAATGELGTWRLPMDAPGSNVHVPPDPMFPATRAIHAKVETSSALTYHARAPVDIAAHVTPERERDLARSGVVEIYAAMRAHALADLALA